MRSVHYVLEYATVLHLRVPDGTDDEKAAQMCAEAAEKLTCKLTGPRQSKRMHWDEPELVVQYVERPPMSGRKEP